MPRRPKRRRRGRRPSAPAPARPTDRSIFSPSPIPLSRLSGWRFVRRALASAAHSIAQRRVPCAPGRPLSLMTFYPPGGNVKQAGRLQRSGDERGGGAGCEMLLRTSSRTQREAMPGGLFTASPPRKRAAPRQRRFAGRRAELWGAGRSWDAFGEGSGANLRANLRASRLAPAGQGAPHWH